MALSIDLMALDVAQVQPKYFNKCLTIKTITVSVQNAEFYLLIQTLIRILEKCNVSLNYIALFDPLKQ